MRHPRARPEPWPSRSWSRRSSHRYIVRHEQYNTRLFRDSVFDTTVVVLDSRCNRREHACTAMWWSINGDLFLQPGAKIDGRAVAIGGGVYDSQQAQGGRREALLPRRALRHRAHEHRHRARLSRRLRRRRTRFRRLALPGLFGLRMPLYDRVDGLSLPMGAAHHARPDTRLVIDPTVTYRSNLGAYDPAVSVRADLARRLAGDGVRRTDHALERSLDSDRSRELGLDVRRWQRLSKLLALRRASRGGSRTSGCFSEGDLAALRRRAHGGRLVRCAAADRGASSTETTRCTCGVRIPASSAGGSRARCSARAAAGSASTSRSTLGADAEVVRRRAERRALHADDDLRACRVPDVRHEARHADLRLSHAHGAHRRRHRAAAALRLHRRAAARCRRSIF